MAVEASGTTSALTLDAETTLNGASFTGDKKYYLVLNLANLTGTEKLRIRVYRKVLSAGSETVVWDNEYQGDQGTEDVVIVGPIYSPHSAKFTLTQSGGTGRTYEWSVESL